MARARSTEPILPFPDDIDREAFGHWLSGFTDGEGSFTVNIRRKNPKGSYRGCCTPMFSITLREDDEEVLQSIRSYWQCGNITRRPGRGNDNPQSRYYAFKFDHLAKIIVPHFDHYPLRAKKARDFAIWREIVLFAYRISGRRRKWRSVRGTGTLPVWTDEELDHAAALSRVLKEQRHYRSAAIELPAWPAPVERKGLFDNL